MRLIVRVLSLALLATAALARDRDSDEQMLFVRATLSGASMHVSGVEASACEVRRPSPSLVIFVVKGAKLSTEGPYRSQIEGIETVTVLGQDQTGSDESRVLLRLEASRLQARAVDAPTGGVNLVLEDQAQALRYASNPVARPVQATPGAPKAKPQPATAQAPRAAQPESPASPSREAHSAGRIGEGAQEQQVAPGADREPPSTEPETASVRETGDGMVAIPAGSLAMGTPQGDAFPDESPQHVVSISAFELDRTEVSVGEFEQSPLTLPRQPEWNWDRSLPVVDVTFEEAEQYCKWLGKRLPSEAEWERAARGPEALQFPWGNAFNMAKVNSGVEGDGHLKTAPVGSLPSGASPYGALDMSGNVWEWVADWYDDDYYERSAAQDPTGPDHGTFRVVRGGSFEGAASINVRAAVRMPLKASARRDNVGFRCAR